MSESKTPSSPSEKPNVRRRPLRWLVRTGLYLLFLFVVVEVSLQFFYYVTVGQSLSTRVGRPLFAPNEFCNYRNKPNLDTAHNTNEFRSHIYTNNDGFRVPEANKNYAMAKDASTYRIMLLGPSFAYGWGVDYDDTFGAHLERLLGEQNYGAGKKIQLINAGVPTLGGAAQLKWYKNVGYKYSPDLVIQFCYGSMVAREPGKPFHVQSDGYLVGERTSAGNLRAIAKKSAVVFYSWMVMSKLRAINATDPGGEVVGAGRDLKIQGEFSPDDTEVVRSMEYYRDLKKTVEESGAEVLVVHFPLSYCIHREDVARWAHLGVRDVDTQILFNDDFCQYLQREGIDCQNISRELSAATEGGQRLYYWLDIHWTPEGNRVAAEAVAARLVNDDDDEAASAKSD